MDQYLEYQTWVLLIVLFVGGFVFTIAFKAYNANIRQIGKTLKKSGRKTKRGISGVQTLMLSTASRIGNGNIAGVSSAIVVGGPGALFWMWMTAIVGMATAFAEGILSQTYKRRQGNAYIGGTPFYIARKGASRCLKIIAAIYSIIAIVTFVGPYIGIQSNTIALNFSNVMSEHSGTNPLIFKLIGGFLLAGALLIVTIRGIKTIGKFSLIVMPVMGAIYLTISLIIIFMNISKFGQVWEWIFEGAFGSKQLIGGIGGFAVLKAINKGVARGAFSNEAGIGSASFAAASSNSRHPVQQGLLQSLSTFIDTIIICSASGFIILFSGAWSSDVGSWNADNSGKLIQESIASNFGGVASKWLVWICITLFGLTTTIGLYYYSETALRFLIFKTYRDIKIYFLSKKKLKEKGENIVNNNRLAKLEKQANLVNFANIKNQTKGQKLTIFGFQLFVAGFIIFCAVINTESIWKTSDILTFILITINVVFMLTQIKFIINLIKDYKGQVRSNKEIKYDYLCDREANAIFKVKSEV